MISLHEAFDRIMAGITPLDGQTLPLLDALGHRLAAPLIALRHQPPADVSAMDGFAIQYHADDSGWKIVGTSAAGAPFEGVIKRGECVRIYTGAELPAGADTVLIQEKTDWPKSSSEINLSGGDGSIKQSRGQHVRAKGQDFRPDSELLAKGTQLGARQISLAAMSGHSDICVIRAPIVALLSTGDELVEPAAATDANRAIPNSNSPMLQALIAAAGGTAIDLGIARDDPEDIKKRIRDAGAFDVLVTIGGASVGDRDFIQSALAELGLESDFWKIRMKPGKPLIHGTLSGRPFLGLPGNPASAFVCALLFLAPLLAALQGQKAHLPRTEKRILSSALVANGDRENFARGAMMPDGSIRPAHSGDSSLSKALSDADGLIWQPAHSPALNAGDYILFMPFPTGF